MERLSSAIATVGMMIGCLLVGASIQTLQAQTPGDGLDSAIKSAVRAGAFEKAASLLEEAARAGNAEAQYQLASLYRSGRGVPQDAAHAFEWMLAAAKAGHPKAQFNVGKMLLAGHGTPVDRKQGEHWLQRAAAAGSDNAVALLAEMASAKPEPHRSITAKTGGWETISTAPDPRPMAPTPRPEVDRTALLSAA